VSQSRRLAIEAAIRLCPSPGSGHHEKALAPGAAQIVTLAPGTPLTPHSQPPFMIAKDFVPI
jgi:hypothetical protein